MTFRILRTGNTEPVTQAVELLGVDRMHDETAINQRIDTRSVRHFDRYRNGMRRPGDRQQPITQLRQTRTVMRELPFRSTAQMKVVIDNVFLLHTPSSQRASVPARPSRHGTPNTVANA
jgi:hypothetical protein